MTYQTNEISFYRLTGTGYERGWWTNFKGRYRCYKGSRNSKKSYVMLGLEALQKIISDPNRNIIFLRKTNRSNKNSTFATLKKLIRQPDPNNKLISFARFFDFNKTDMTITYKPTGQVILFLGFDNADKLTSLRAEFGYFTDLYVEEAFEIKDEEEFDKLDGTLRGKLPEGCFFQITFALNGWDDGHWLKKRFFDGRLEDDREYLMNHAYMDYRDMEYEGNYGQGLYLHISTYKINEFRDTTSYDRAMEHLRLNAPQLYDVVALGMWGVSSGKTYPEFNDTLIVSPNYATSLDYCMFTIGIDTGLSNGEGKIKNNNGDERYKSAMTMHLQALTSDNSKIVALREYFHSNQGLAIPKTEQQVMDEMVSAIIEWYNLYRHHPVLMKGTILIYVDAADIGFRQGIEMKLRERGMYNCVVQGSTKFPIHQRIMFDRTIQSFGEHLVSTDCPNLIREYKNSRKGENGRPREDFDDHCLNSHEYGWAPFTPRIKKWRETKKIE